MSGQSEQDFIEQFGNKGADDNIDNGAQNDNENNLDTGQQNLDPVIEQEFSASEQKAYDQGWRPQEEFEGDEDNWKTAKEYNRDGEWLDKLKTERQRTDQMQRDFDDRLEASNQLHQARHKQELDSLKAKQREAVDLADTAAYDTATRQIDELKDQELPTKAPQQKQQDPEITAWVDQNPWINDPNDDRTIMAQGALNQFQQSNPDGSISDAIKFVEERVNRLGKPSGNPRRDQPNANENTRKPQQRRSRELTMGDLTPGEQSEWDKFGRTIFKTEKAFLKAVKDARVK